MEDVAWPRVALKPVPRQSGPCSQSSPAQGSRVTHGVAWLIQRIVLSNSRTAQVRPRRWLRTGQNEVFRYTRVVFEMLSLGPALSPPAVMSSTCKAPQVVARATGDGLLCATNLNRCCHYLGSTCTTLAWSRCAGANQNFASAYCDPEPGH